MHIVRRAATIIAVALLLGAPLSAQRYRWDLNINGGYSFLTGNVLSRSDFNFVGGDASLNNGATAGAQLGYWFDQRFGVRANFAFTGSKIDGPRELITGDRFDVIDRDVNFAGFTADFMTRLKMPRTKWSGHEWLPYAAVGLGLQWIRPGGGHDFGLVDEFGAFENPEGGGRNAVPIRCTAVLDRCAVLAQSTRFTGLAGLGVDLRFTPGFALRAEAGDRIWEAPVREVLIDRNFSNVFHDVGGLGRTVNQLYVTAGLAIVWGLERPPAHISVQTGSTRLAPAPPPPPTTQTVKVCVVDPTSPQGLRTVTATRNDATGDTTVLQNGRSIPLATAVGKVPVAGSADWYLHGAPLEIGVAPNQLQFVRVGGEQRIGPEQLVYIGTVNGVPVFAERSTLPPALGNLGPNTDLNRIAVESADVRRALETVRVIYVPLQATNCLFQALQKRL